MDIQTKKLEILNYVFKSKDGCTWNELSEMLNEFIETINKIKNQSDKTVEELKQIREDYINKYIGDFDKPSNYTKTLFYLDRLVRAKEALN